MKFPNRAHVYGVEGGFPMLFDIDGRGSEIFPTGSSLRGLFPTCILSFFSSCTVSLMENM